MVKKYKTRAEAITALGDDALKESINGPLAALVGPKLMQLQVDAIVAMQERPMVGVPLLSMIGSGQIILVINCLVRWYDTTGLSWRPSFVSAVMLCFNGCFKAYFKGPRPYWVSDKVKTLDPTLETSYGFPSGHSTGMIAIYGVMAWHYNIPFFYAVWAVLSLAVMYSRVYTGAHFIHDVVGGAIMGFAILWVDIINEKYLSVSGTRGSITEMFALSLMAAGTFCAVMHVAGWTGRVKFMIVYEGVSGAGFAAGLAICHFLDLVAPLMCEEQPPLPIFPVIMGVVGVIVIDKTMKRLPEYPDGTRDLWCLLLTMMGFAGVMIWTVWGMPRIFFECPVSPAPVVIGQ